MDRSEERRRRRRGGGSYITWREFVMERYCCCWIGRLVERWMLVGRLRWVGRLTLVEKWMMVGRLMLVGRWSLVEKWMMVGRWAGKWFVM